MVIKLKIIKWIVNIQLIDNIGNLLLSDIYYFEKHKRRGCRYCKLTFWKNHNAATTSRSQIVFLVIRTMLVVFFKLFEAINNYQRDTTRIPSPNFVPVNDGKCGMLKHWMSSISLNIYDNAVRNEGYSVTPILKALRRLSSVVVPITIASRRQGISNDNLIAFSVAFHFNKLL